MTLRVMNKGLKCNNHMNEVKEERTFTNDINLIYNMMMATFYCDVICECSLAKRKCTKTHAKRWNVSSFEGNPSKKQNGNFSTGIAIVR